MDGMTAAEVISRWFHVGTAIVLLGGSVFMRFVLIPSAEPMPEADHAALRERIMGRWRRFVHAGIGLLLLTGLFNYVRQIPLHKGDGLYHALMGVKMLLAFGVFFLASALAGRSAAFEGLRQARKKWLLVTILLAFAIVAISGYLKVARKGKDPVIIPGSSIELPVNSSIAGRRCPAKSIWHCSTADQFASG